MAVPYHTHTFEIPAATKEDVIAGVATDKAVTPSALGSCAVQNVEDFATADQGKKADTAIQPEDLAKVATTGDYADLDNRPALGSAATMDATAFATAVQGALANSAVQPQDIGSAATHDASDFATVLQGSRADSALQPSDVKSAAHKEASDFAPFDAALPYGGGVGQVLSKRSEADRDVSWITVDAAASVAYAPQTLADDQRGQARVNIGAGTFAWNWVINGNFNIIQRQGVRYGVFPPDTQYGPDRWKSLSGQYVQV